MPDPTCGDGNLDAGETCDDGNLVDGDGCDSNCTPTGCGNGVVTAGEICDDANDISGDGCDANCTITSCGNGVVTAGETCDDGNSANGDGCDANCTPTGCGNGVVTAGETCDDGNLDDGDGCDANCGIEPPPIVPVSIAARGASILLEDVLDATAPRWVRPNSACLPQAGAPPADSYLYRAFAIRNDTGADQVIDVAATWAGDGILFVFSDAFAPPALDGCLALNDDEFFDDTSSSRITDFAIAPGQVLYVVATTFNQNDPIGAFTIEVITQADPVVCGDGDLGGDEVCDDANLVDGDGCDSNCTITACGNGIVTLGEICDDGNAANGDGCDNNCTATGCGNGIVTAGETCDDGNISEGDGCDAECAIEQVDPVCGNGQVEGDEGCDDGNLTSGDACDASCEVEPLIPRPVNLAPPGGTLDFQGTITTRDARFVRPNAACAPDFRRSYYEVIALRNAADTVRTVDITATWEEDGFLFVFDDSFVPGVNAGCLIGNDDFNGVAGSQIADFVLQPGQVVYVLAASYDSDPSGAYTVAVFTQDAPLTVCGDGNLEAGETCDDGNLDNGDGCSDACRVEAIAIPAPGQSLLLEGAIEDTDRTWARPTAACSARAGNQFYDVFALRNDTGADQILDLAAAWNGDGFLHVFDERYAPPGIDGCVVGNDDDTGDETASRLSAVPIAAGQVLYVIASSFSNDAAIGDFLIEVVTLPPVGCGNGNLDPGEACDDGNLDNGDGCDANCTRDTFDITTSVYANTDRIPVNATDAYRFTLDAAGVVRVATSDLAPGEDSCVDAGDTIVGIFAVVGGVRAVDAIAIDDDSGAAPLCSLLETALPAGTYDVVVASAVAEVIPAYEISVQVLALVPTPGDYNGLIAADGDDGYLITIPSDNTWRLKTGDGADGCPVDADTILRLYSVDAATGALTLVDENDDAVPHVVFCSELTVALAPGNYVAIVTGFQGDPVPPYVFSLACTDCQVPLRPVGPGDLVITEIMQNPSAVNDDAGEWFEVVNIADGPVELQGMVVQGNAANDTFTVAGSVVLQPGEYFVFGLNGNQATNGGVPVDYVYANFTLNNSSDTVRLLSASAALIDLVVYDNGATFPDPNGASMQFGLSALAGGSDNAVGSNWCTATSPYGSGNLQDLGTPGAPNLDCP